MSNNKSEVITFSRNELYEKIWNTPTTKLARDFGFSDVALGKICKKHSIPKPPLGYWAKLAHGKTVARPPLPSIGDQRLETIEIRKRPLVSGGPKPQSTEDKEPSIPVPERLTSPHPLVRSTIDALKNATPDDTGISRLRTGGCLNVRVGRQSVGRAMHLMDALIKALEARGSTVSVVERDRRHQTSVKILDETIEIDLREGWIEERSNSQPQSCVSAKSPHGYEIVRNMNFTLREILFLPLWAIMARASAKCGRTEKGSGWRTA